MNRMLIALVVASLLAGAPVAAARADAGIPTTKREAAAQWSEDGLQKTKVAGLDLVYVRPGADLSEYSKVLIEPVSVGFRRDWERNASIGTDSRIRRGARQADIQRIKEELARIVRQEVVRELGRGGYQLVNAPGGDVLEINLRVAELYLNAPDLPTAGRVRTYTMSFGEMTLVAELRDSVTGDVVMRILDRTTGRDFRAFRLTTRVENAAELSSAANAWARALRRELDLTKRVGSAH